MKEKIRNEFSVNFTREVWADQAKALTMLLIIFYHASTPFIIAKYWIPFMIPIYFFISGYFYKNKKISIGAFLKKQFWRMWLPMVSLTFISCLIVSVLHFEIKAEYFKPVIFTALQIPGTDYRMWFIGTMISVQIIVYILEYIGNFKYLFGMIAVVLGIINAYTLHIQIVYHLEIAIVMLAFYYLGTFFCHNRNAIVQYLDKKKINYNVLLAGCAIIYFVLQTVTNNPVDVALSQYGNLFLFVISSLLGITTIIWFTKQIRIGLLLYIGRNTLAYYGLQSTLLWPATIVSNRIAKFIWGDVTYVYFLSGIFCVLVLLIIVPMINICVPRLVGKR